MTTRKIGYTYYIREVIFGLLWLTESLVRYDARRRDEFRKEQQRQQAIALQQQQKLRRKSTIRRKTRRKSEFVFGDVDEGEGGGVPAENGAD